MSKEMTNEEAINEIVDMADTLQIIRNSNKGIALQMAIAALKAKPCGDAISRQAALDAIMGEPTDAHYPSWYARRIEDLPLVHAIPKAEPCKDAISRQAAIDTCLNIYFNGYTEKDLLQDIKKLPSVNLQEPKTGYWIALNECSNSGYYCSKCYKKVVKEGWSDTVKKIKYCPNCGAKMIEPQEREVSDADKEEIDEAPTILRATESEEQNMTYNDLLKKFSDAFPLAKIDDYRPVCHELFENGKVGITIWLKNGDMVVYYPKQEEREDKE